MWEFIICGLGYRLPMEFLYHLKVKITSKGPFVAVRVTDRAPLLERCECSETATSNCKLVVFGTGKNGDRVGTFLSAVPSWRYVVAPAHLWDASTLSRVAAYSGAVRDRVPPPFS